jgi:PIN domain nuclease of toxin-antitoxin system
MLTEPRRLGAEARKAIGRVEAGRGEAWVPAAVVAETLILRDLGRVAIGMGELRKAFEGAAGLHFLPLDLGQLEEFAALASIRDPFDRLVLGAARRLGAALITRDRQLREIGLVETIW